MKNPILTDLNDLVKTLGPEQLAHELKLLQVRQEHERKMNEDRIKTLERQIESFKESFEWRLRMETEKVELRLRLELAEHLRLFHPLHPQPKADE